MRCEDVQAELARDPADAVVRQAVEAHLAGCPACESVRRLYGLMDAALHRAPMWEPPLEFSRRVAALVRRPTPSRSWDRRMLSSDLVDAALPGLLVAAVGCLAGLAADALVVDAALAGWLCGGLALWVAASFTRRAIA
jgi:anti-sigma factor RsiW